MGKKPVEQAGAGAPRGLAGLKIFVTVAGAVLMALEIVGSRLLAPHFGNSVFVWGSLIGVFLAALSLGYWIGGILADRHPTPGRLAAFSIATAALIFLIPWLGHPICARLAAAGLGEQAGPLIASVILFLPPSFLLGMVSPFSVRIATASVTTVGRSAGSLYALSTLGSIAGTFLTTFLLVPLVGVMAIVRCLGVTMLVLPIFLARKKGDATGSGAAAAVVILLGGLLLPASPAQGVDAGEVVILEEDTPYHHVRVSDLFDHRVRALRFDHYTESAIALAGPRESLAKYTDYFHLAWLLRPEMKRVLFIGAGGGIGPRTFHETDPTLEIDVVDVDARVIEIAREHFFMPDVPQIHAHAQDGRMFTQAAAPGYDCIVLDAFTIGGRIPFHLTTREAFRLCSDRLVEGGVFVMNTNSAISGRQGEIFQSIGRTMREVFPGVQAFAEGSRLDPTPTLTRNVIFVATKGHSAAEASEWRALAATFQARSSISRVAVDHMVADLVVQWPDVSKAPLLTDDHAPIETMGF